MIIMFVLKRPPCQYCEDREINCHSKCDKYQNFYQEKEKIKDEINKQIKKERMFDDYIIKKISKRKKRK